LHLHWSFKIKSPTFTTKKTHISCQFCFEFFFVENTYKFCYEKKICKKLLPIFLQNILYKTLFATNFVRNTCKFYNFVGNNYPRRNYLPIKFLRKNSRKKSFLANFFNKFARKFSCNMRICSSVWSTFSAFTFGFVDSDFGFMGIGASSIINQLCTSPF